MPAVPDGSLILVTGVNGYLGSHIAKQLLDHGFRVRGTVREALKADYMHALFDEKYGSDVFTTCIVEDMATTGAFDDVTKAKETSVKRFVMTSSCVTATSTFDNGLLIDTASWNDPKDDIVWAPAPYHSDREAAVYIASKIASEKSCWRFMEEQKPSFIFNAVLPGLVLGRIMDERQPASSAGLFKKIWEKDEELTTMVRTFPMQFFVDVTDLAVLHVAALREEDVDIAIRTPSRWQQRVIVQEKKKQN
ncbi:hypothetical protein CDD80_4699 [Ophiocordyceps camponoti-rufipedis]|uniref:NAD-dependent epimerase/dehydratase domain-containing protein n=1 Tax=Ophiocordyceps camponoti-rufipedis TaxID=2004952 RepID=A0A2C5ZIA6_9HYPO|nr:hypothetical protein CDD80_4699 [Ophiocordyceps camponoti-rufipedis]